MPNLDFTGGSATGGTAFAEGGTIASIGTSFTAVAGGRGNQLTKLAVLGAAIWFVWLAMKRKV
jgi:hypothetical protein